MASRGESSRSEATEEEEDPLPQLPFVILLEIIQRADAPTVVPCAATQKLLSPAFRPRLGLGVDPALLLGFSFWEHGGHRSIDTPPLPAGGTGGQPRVRLDGDAIAGFEPVAWRHGLLLLIKRHPGVGGKSHGQLRVCDAFTVEVTASPPPFSLPIEPSGNMQWPWPSSHTFGFLTAAGRSFELLVANMGLQTQMFSSDRWEWGPVRDTSFPRYQHLPRYQNPRYLHYDAFSRPAVIGRTIHWLCSNPPVGEPVAFNQYHQRGAGYLKPHILSVDVDAAEATLSKVPRDCFSKMVPSSPRWSFNTRALLTSVRRRLCLFVLESHGISGWTPSDDPESTTWSMRFMVTRPELEARAALDPRELTQLRLHAYGELSGTMILEVTPRVFLRLDIGGDLDLERVVRLGSGQDSSKSGQIACLCLHEIPLVSLLQAMKLFLP